MSDLSMSAPTTLTTADLHITQYLENYEVAATGLLTMQTLISGNLKQVIFRSIKVLFTKVIIATRIILEKC